MADGEKKLYRVKGQRGERFMELSEAGFAEAKRRGLMVEEVPRGPQNLPDTPIPGTVIVDPAAFKSLQAPEHAKLREAVAANGVLEKGINEMVRLREEHGSEWGTEAAGKYDAAQTLVIGGLTQLAASGVLNPSEFERYKGMLPSLTPGPTDLARVATLGAVDPTLNKIKGFRDMVSTLTRAKLSASGVDLATPATGEQPPPPPPGRPAPQGGQAPPPPPPQAPPAREPSAGEAFGRSFANPFGMGGEVAKGVSKVLDVAGVGDDDTGIPRTYAAGSRAADLAGQVDREREEAAAANPTAAAVGRGVVDTAAMMALPGGAAAQGAVAGGLTAGGESEETGLALAGDVAVGGGGGALTGKAIERVLKLGGPAAKKAEEWLRQKANVARVRAPMMSGGGRQQFEQLQNKIGDEGIQKLGADIERLGLHKGKGLLGKLPQPASTYRKNALAVIPKAAQELSDAEAAIQASGAQVQTGEVVKRLRTEGQRLMGLADTAAKRRGMAMLNEAASLAKAARFGRMSAKEAFANKRAYQEVHEELGQKGVQSAPFAKKLRADIGKGMRKQIDADIERRAIADANLTPRQAALALQKGRQPLSAKDVTKYRQANRDITVAKTVEPLARKAVAQEEGNINQALRLTNIGPAVIGSSVGGPAGAVVAPIAGNILRGRGSSAAAGIYRTGSKVLSGMEQGAPSARVASAAMRAAAAEKGPDAAREVVQELTGAEKVREIATRNPEALGKYGADLAVAAKKGTIPFAVTHKRLMETDPGYQELVKEAAP